MTIGNQPIFVIYSSATSMTKVARRWLFATTEFPPIRETIDQMDTRSLFELVSDTTALSNGFKHRIVAVGNREAVSVFSEEKEHPFLVDQQHDYYPTGRVAHNYVRIENDPVNMLGTAPTTDEEAYVEASYRIGSLRKGYHRKVEHMGGTPRIEDIYDINTNLTTVPLFPPKSVSATPDRYFLRASDMGYVHYIKSSYHVTNNEALEVKNVTGSKEFIWDKTDMIRGAVIPGDLIDNAAVEVKDVEVLQNAALNAIDTDLNNTWLAEDQVWERFHIPGRTKIKMSATAVEITQLAADYNTVTAQFIMTLGGSIVIKNTETSLVTMTITGGKVDVS